ncbi:uncharacterized protein LOC114254067 [Monomorium pharaonis]|uniref:uncharacterized protein LOC114254067 n=1 Tax=Monomorium pharaonis TaxID=307658 RepID=UPI00174681B3|nr:uncharacterized protein LOC114254067 [Monomorium pharaonis]
MTSIVDKYFSLNRTFLLIVGLWPYQYSKFSRFYLFCCYSIIATTIIFQFATFVTSKCTADYVAKFCSLSFGIITLAVIYNSFYVNSDKLRYSIEQLQLIYDDLKDIQEIAIFEKYGNISKRYTAVFIIAVVCDILIFVSIQFWPEFINIILTTNESRSRRLQIFTEYFIDQERYYYIQQFQINAAFCIGLIAFATTGSMHFTCHQHACGMFKIASYRIKKAIEIYIQSINLKNKNLVYNGLIYGVLIHRKAIMFSEYLVSNFQMSFMFSIIFGIFAISLNIFQVFQILSSKLNAEELLIHFIILLTFFTYMFFSNFIGQEITDHYNLIFATAYEVRWYTTPLCVQKLIQFLLLRGNKSFGLKVGKMFEGSLQCFATLTNASLSYFIAMNSIKN